MACENLSADETDQLDLPVLGPMPVMILGLLKDQSFSMATLADAVRLDQSVSDQLIKLAGCPLYGASQKFEDLTKAVVYLGLRNALSMALSISLFKGMRGTTGTWEEQWCWKRILINAVACRELVKLTKTFPVDMAFLNGLVQDFGLLILIQQRPALYNPLVTTQLRRPEPFSFLEARTIGVTHDVVSEAILEQLNFPADCVSAAGRHHDPALSMSADDDLAVLQNLAERSADFLLNPSSYTFRWLERGYLKIFKKDGPKLDEFLQSVNTGTRALADVLQVNFPPGLDPVKLIKRVLEQEAQEQAEENAAAAKQKGRA